MQNDAIARLIQLRHRLKDSASADVQDVLLQINVTMGLLLKQEVCIDFMESTSNEATVVSKVISLTQVAQNIGDAQLREDALHALQGIMSACLSCTVLGASHTQLPCNGMSMDEKMQHMRSSLLLVL
jgi:hypothetical protein